jgi:threonine/homoserine/homoserine lactone efflux protein
MQPATSYLLTLLSIGLVQLLAVMSPGPSFLITARTAVARSRADGVKVALGLGAGTVVWAVAALLGLNVLFRALPPLFMAMKVLGALFLLWIAFQIFRHAAAPLALEGSKGEGVTKPFMEGFLTQISNPKGAVFFGSIFIAMLPAQVLLWMTLALVASSPALRCGGILSWPCSLAQAGCASSI